MDTNILITFLLLLPVIYSLKDVRVSTPGSNSSKWVFKKLDHAVLFCTFDLEGDSLMTVKWYRGRREFYRYSPMENPAMQIFPIPGVHVVQAASNVSQLTLGNVIPSTSGKYSCEVTADFPSFHSGIASGDLEIVEVPVSQPVIHGIKNRYKVDEIVRGNCTSKYSKPAANLTWTINDHIANPPLVRPHKPMKSNKNDLEISVLGLHFVVTSQHFANGKLKVKCIARIHEVYQQSNERLIEEEKPRVIQAASSSQNNVNMGLQPYIPYDQADNEIDKHDTYMTNIKGDASSLNSASVPRQQHSSLLTFALTSSIVIFNYVSRFYHSATLLTLSSSTST